MSFHVWIDASGIHVHADAKDMRKLAGGAGAGSVGFADIVTFWFIVKALIEAYQKPMLNNFDDFYGAKTLSDGDVIKLNTENLPVGHNHALIVLRKPLPVDWWKETKVNGPAGSNFIGLSGSTEEVGTLYVAEEHLAASELVFVKAKTFGVHTEMYRIKDLSDLRGKLATFTWRKD